MLMSASVLADPVAYRLGINEEMPSNQVYNMLVDRHGYLWIATAHSVVRYNGYETKVFDLSDGLPSADIWDLYEDNLGRIWVFCFCNVLGYIWSDEFHIAPLENPPSQWLYPKIWDVGDRIILYNRQDNSDRQGMMYFETGETMPGFRFDHVYWAYYDSLRNELFYMLRGNPRDQSAAHGVYKAKILPGQVVRELHYPVSEKLNSNDVHFVFDKYYIRSERNNQIHFFDIVDTVWRASQLGDGMKHDGIKVFSRSRNALWIYSGDYLYGFNKAMEQTEVFPIPSFLRSMPVISVLYDSLWGSCFGTDGNGLHIAENRENGITSFMPPKLSGYSCIGQARDHMPFWWNRWDKRLFWTDNDGRTMQIRYPDKSTGAIIKVVSWTKTHSILLGINSFYLLNHHTGRLVPFFQGKQLDHHQGLSVYALRNLDMVAGDAGEFFLLSRSGLYRFYEHHDTVRVNLIEPEDSLYKDESYVHITYDPYRKVLWAHNSNTVLKYDGKGKAQVFKSGLQESRVVRNIEQILVDERYGTLFLKEFDRIRMHDRYGQRFKEVLRGINLRKTVACISDDLLVVAGRFGVAISRILAYGKLSDPVIYTHAKNIQYENVYDVHIIDSEVVITTDKGLLSVPVPDSMAFMGRSNNSQQKDYRVLLGYGGVLRTIIPGDSLRLSQEDMKLHFDLVRPSGNGTLKCAYFLVGKDVKWNTVNGKDLVLPALKPGSTTRMLLRFSDDVWISDPVAVDLYVVPYWWQTPGAGRVIWGGAVLGLLGLVAASVWITRRIVVRNNLRRNMHMEIELKALYAQINPHFIFNTLNSALLFIETRRIEDAYTHVFRFSRLLRSYIKSSRNRYVSVSEEIENLRNYINLQQVRYRDKFDYEILVEDGVEIKRIQIPALLLQPIVENAINHGLFHKKEKGRLNISFRKGNDSQEIICIIEDNGVGRKQSKQIRKSSTLKNESYGEQLIEDLIRIFNKYESMDIRIVYQDKELPETGTVVSLYIKKDL